MERASRDAREVVDNRNCVGVQGVLGLVLGPWLREMATETVWEREMIRVSWVFGTAGTLLIDLGFGYSV